jgi:hypothetical protein
MKRHPNHKLTIDQEKEAIEKYQSGMSLDAVGKIFNTNLVTIRNVLKRNGFQTRKAGNGFKIFSDEEIKTIVQLYKSNNSIEKIAKQFKTSTSLISRNLRRNGVNIRNKIKENHHNWKGGRLIVGGYVQVIIDANSPYVSMARNSRYVLEHRLVMAQHLGRCLQQTETVHHIDGNKLNNSIENLQLRHGKHGKHQVFMCCDCGSKNVTTTTL